MADKALEIVSLKEFFENVPPLKRVQLKERPAGRNNIHGGLSAYEFEVPLIQLHCSEPCNGERLFDPDGKLVVIRGEDTQRFVNFECRNCGKSRKEFAVLAMVRDESRACEITKYGELWPFGPYTPAKVISLVGPDREYFLRGRRCENQGLGIGAFAYYRRVIENQKNRVLEEIINVSRKLGAASEMIADLETAKTETQFSKVIDSVKHGIPEVLLINGHNPLTLLHSALSAGLHEDKDDECLALAKSIRVVMTDMAEKISQALKNEKEITEAVGKLMEIKSAKVQRPAVKE